MGWIFFFFQNFQKNDDNFTQNLVKKINFGQIWQYNILMGVFPSLEIDIGVGPL